MSRWGCSEQGTKGPSPDVSVNSVTFKSCCDQLHLSVKMRSEEEKAQACSTFVCYLFSISNWSKTKIKSWIELEEASVVWPQIAKYLIKIQKRDRWLVQTKKRKSTCDNILQSFFVFLLMVTSVCFLFFSANKGILVICVLRNVLTWTCCHILQ